jgi:hypothetical protein
MKKLTATICLTIAVLLGNFVYISTTSASEFVQSRFGRVILNLPYPNNLCLLGKSPVEKILWEHQNLAQRQVGLKLLAIWINCNSQQMMQNAENSPLEEWVIVVATLTGTPKNEKVYPQLGPDKYLNIISNKYGKLSLDKILKRTNRSIEKANTIYLGDRNAVEISDPINIGVLAVEDSVHTGMIINVKAGIKTIPTLVILSTSLIKGVPLYHYFYSTYKGKKTLTKLLPKAKNYTAKIIHAN